MTASQNDFGARTLREFMVHILKGLEAPPFGRVTRR